MKRAGGRRKRGARAPASRAASAVAIAAAVLVLAAPGAAQETDDPPAAVPPAAAAAEREVGRSGLSREEFDALAAEVSAQLRCPVCRNQSVLESSATLSREMQDVVRERLAAGESPEQVKRYFVSRYGEWILLKPPAEGFNLLVYLLPAVALVLGGLLLRNRLRAWTAAGGGTPGTETEERGDLSPENERWLQEALRRG